MRHFEDGAVRDSEDGKEDYIETISWTALKRFARYMTGKKAKYGHGNFKKGIPIDSYERSAVRHLQKYLENKYEEGDVETEEDHLSAILFNVMGIMHECERESKKNKSITSMQHNDQMWVIESYSNSFRKFVIGSEYEAEEFRKSEQDRISRDEAVRMFDSNQSDTIHDVSVTKRRASEREKRNNNLEWIVLSDIKAD